MTVKFHPGDEVLLAYVTGGLPPPLEVVVACHLTFCPSCHDQTVEFEVVGGVMLEQLENAPLEDSGIERVLARLDEPASQAVVPPPNDEESDANGLLPAPLRAFIGKPARQLDWFERAPGMSVVELAGMDDGAVLRLMRAAPGLRLPRHDHGGTELTLVLEGGLIDANDALHRGDLLAMEPGAPHEPVVDENDGCVVLFATDGDLISVD